MTATCNTCQHYQPAPTNTSGQCNEIGSPHGNHHAYLTMSNLASSPPLYQNPRPILVLSPNFGCILHTPQEDQK